jgi:hypothetical protein
MSAESKTLSGTTVAEEFGGGLEGGKLPEGMGAASALAGSP